MSDGIDCKCRCRTTFWSYRTMAAANRTTDRNIAAGELPHKVPYQRPI